MVDVELSHLVFFVVGVLVLALVWWFLSQARDATTLLLCSSSKETQSAYFKGKCVWITGASSGIGAELATQIAALRVNARIVISARRVERLDELAARLNALGGADVRVVRCDVSDVGELERAYAQVKKVFGAVDVLVNNAGIPLRRLVVQSDAGAADQLHVLDVNLRSHMVLTTMVAKDMAARGAGHIVAVSSLVGILTVPCFAAYIATKRGMHGYYDSLRLELLGKRAGVAVTLICPGTIATEVWEHKWNRSAAADSYMDEHFKTGCLPASTCVAAIMVGLANRSEELWITANALEKLGVYMVYYLPPIGNYFVRSKNDELMKEF
jgi:short-subunit dehydrogenase